jgi:hypothetical protein
VTVEISVESYAFTCARCATRWTESYQVSQVIDDAGGVRSFYRHQGDPCEAPVGGNVECPHCHATQASRDPLYGQPPDFAPADFAPANLARAELAGGAQAAPPQQSEEVPPQRRRHATGTWRRYKFSAVVTLETAGPARRQYLSGVPGLVLHAPSCQPPARHQYFPAIVNTDDNRPLQPGERGVDVVISVPDDDASSYFRSGQHFIVWDGAEIGHGTVAQRLVLQWW